MKENPEVVYNVEFTDQLVIANSLDACLEKVLKHREKTPFSIYRNGKCLGTWRKYDGWITLRGKGN